MTTIRITINVDGDIADPSHPTGLTNEGYEQLFDALGAFGHDIDIAQEPGNG